MRRFLKPIFFIIFLAGLLIILHYLNILQPLENFTRSLAKPLQQPLYRVANFFHWSEKKDLATWQQENEQLYQQLISLLNENARLKNKLADYQTLTQQLAYIEEKQCQSVPARI